MGGLCEKGVSTLSFTYKIYGKKLSATSTEDWTFESRPGGWVIGQDKKSGRRVRFYFWQKGQRIGVSSQGVLWAGECTQDRQALSSAGGASSEGDLVAQFPGKVRKILVKKGAQVAEGDPLILVEAMKMEFAIKAPFNGKVSQILVEEGQQVLPGARFLDLEAEQQGK